MWTITPPTEKGFYWYKDKYRKSIVEAFAPTRDTLWWRFFGSDDIFSSEQMLLDNGIWWNQRLNAPE